MFSKLGTFGRVLPQPKNVMSARQSIISLLLAPLLVACAPSSNDSIGVRPGLEVLLSDSLHLVRDRRVGLVTNHTALDRQGRHAIDVMRDHGVDLVALFSPEHGIRGRADAGERVESGLDEASGLPVHSLYGATRKPTSEMLAGLDVLVFDIQDIGARYYTYVSTMALAMSAAAEHDLPFVVLDRPNPIGGRLVQGNVLEPEHASFVGLYPIPTRHGMTVGELARFFNAQFGIGAELHVVPVAGWRRGDWFDATGLHWVAPSPNMPSLESATHYPGTCLFEGTNLSVGRGTDRAFQQIGAPWLDGNALSERLNGRALAGVRFEPVSFTPQAPGDRKFDGVAVSGVRWMVTDREVYDPTVAAVAALIEARELASDNWTWRPAHFDRLAGTATLRARIEAGESLDAIVQGWTAQRTAFMELGGAHLLY